MKIHAPVERLSSNHVDEDQANDAADDQTSDCAQDPQAKSLDGEYRSNLASREAQMSKHAELGATSECLCAGVDTDSKQADHHRNRLQHVRDRKNAIEAAQLTIAQLRGHAQLQGSVCGQRA